VGAHVRTATIEPGRSYPLGAVPQAGGTNFSVYSRNATGVELLLFDCSSAERPARTIELDPTRHCTWHYWHVFVPGVTAGQVYGYRAHGPFVPERGLRFDGGKLLLDPYGRCVTRAPSGARRAASMPGDNVATAMRSVVVDPRSYEWAGDRRPRTPFAKTIVYELHVGHFTRHPNSGVGEQRRGTFSGLIDKIPYLLDLGITAVELMPVFAFDEDAAPVGLKNVWGYQPISFFAPHPGYCSQSEPLAALDEFRDMVRALHRAGIEVILDVVYNHTAEGGAEGPTVCFRGFANATYYILNQADGAFKDYSGTGNSLNANESVVRRMILDSLRYWSSEMHVDGFRFDLAAVLSRDEDGTPLAAAPILSDISSDPVLADVKLIAEAWDASGLYELGRFTDKGWIEWNGRFRDEVRGFVKGDNGAVAPLIRRILGSRDLYHVRPDQPARTINFVTCHDGFTLRDLVSYNAKHNQANLEANRDGADDNHSWNCGVEGETEDLAVNRLRSRQARNLLALTLVSAGTPMLLMGDELGRTQRGNNNPYCIDDETTWLDWSGIETHADMHRFTRALIALRRQHTLASPDAGPQVGEPVVIRRIEWHGVRLHQPDWGDESHSLACAVHFGTDLPLLYFAFNAYWEPLGFEIPGVTPGYGPWRRYVDTSQSAPLDICCGPQAPAVEGASVLVQPRSSVLLYSHALQPATHAASLAPECAGERP
jgi:isoamylase